jgi:D-alanine-D-alanine ligase
MVENGVIGRELEIAVLENIDDVSAPLVSMPGEIVLHHDFYSYAAKYLDEDGARLDLSPTLPGDVVRRMQKTAACLFKAMNAEGLGRADFLYDELSDKLYFNEINSLPGFTSISMYPKMWSEAGLSYQTLLTKLVDLACARFERASVLKSSPTELEAVNS